MHPTDQDPKLNQQLKLNSGFQLNYIDLGTGPVVLMLHGSGPGAGGHSNFKGNYPSFVEAGFRVIIPDHLGFGYSDKPDHIDYHIDVFVQSLFDLLEQLKVQQCHVIGNSLGGSIAIQMALQRPEIFQKIILMAPGAIEEQQAYFDMPGMAAMGDFYRQQIGQSLNLQTMRTLLEKLVYDAGDVDDETVQERLAIFQQQNSQLMSSLTIPNREQEIAQLIHPMLVLWGANDQFMPANGAIKITQRCPNSEAIVFSRCGHWVMTEKQAAFNRLCLQYLSQE